MASPPPSPDPGVNINLNMLLPMPNPHDKGTLHFKGKDIDTFLAKFEYYADRANLTMVGRCKALHLYFSKKEKALLDILDGYRHQDWSQLKRELQSLYTSSHVPDVIQFLSKRSKSKVPDPEIGRPDRNSFFGSETPRVPECPSSSSLCKMCRESYHSICECPETKFLILLGICYLDMHGRVFMTDGSALPQAKGEGGVAHAIRECEVYCTSTSAPTSDFGTTNSKVEGTTPDLESVALSPPESPILSVEHEMELKDLAPGSEVHDDSFDDSGMSSVMCSSSYDYMNDIDDFMSNDDMYQLCDRPRDQLWSSYSSPEPESVHSDSEWERSQASTPGIGLVVGSNPSFGFKYLVAPESEPLLTGTFNQVVMRDGLALLPRDGEEGAARVIRECEAYRTATRALNESVLLSSIEVMLHDHEYETAEGLVDWNLKQSSTLPDLSESTEMSSTQYSYGELMSTFPMHFDSSCSTRNYDYMNDIDEFMSVEEKGEICEEFSPYLPSSLAPETSQSSYELSDNSLMHYLSGMMHLEAHELQRSLVSLKSESESESSTAQSMSPISLVQSNYSSPMSAPSVNLALDRIFTAVKKSQCMLVHSARMLNLMTIRASLRKSHLKFSDGAERCALYDAYVQAEEVDLPNPQVPSGNLDEPSIQRVLKQDPRYLRVSKLKLVPAASCEFNVAISALWTSRTERPSRSMLLDSGSDSNIENVYVWKAPELESLHAQLKVRILLAQPCPLDLVRTPSALIAPDHRFQARTRPLRFSVSSARALNLNSIRTSLRRSSLDFDDGVERCISDDVYSHAGAAGLPIIQAPLRELHETSIQHASKLDLEYLIRVIKLKFVSAPFYESSTMGTISQMSSIEDPSHSMLVSSDFDLNIENVHQAPDLVLIHEGSDESWMIINLRELDLSIEDASLCLPTGVETRPSTGNLAAYFDHGAEAAVFIQTVLSSRRIDHIFGIVLLTSLIKNSARRACSLFVYLVVWAPKAYIAGSGQCFCGVRRVKDIRAEAQIIEFLWNGASFMMREFNTKEQRPVGLDDFIDRGIISNTSCFSILKDIEVFRIAKLKSQKRRPVAIGLSRDYLPYIPLLYYFVKMPTESSQLDAVPELIAGVPIISNSGGLSTVKLDPENELEQTLHPVPHAISSQTPASRPASAGLAHKPSLLPHGIGTVTRSPVRRVLYGLFKPLLMITRDVSRIRMSMVLSSLT